MEDTSVSLAPLAGYLSEAIMLVIIGIAGWGVAVLRERVGLEKDSAAVELIEKAIDNGFIYAANRLDQIGENAEIDIKNEVVREVTEYVIGNVPTALRRVGVDAEQLSRLVLAQIVPASMDEDDA